MTVRVRIEPGTSGNAALASAWLQVAAEAIRRAGDLDGEQTSAGEHHLDPVNMAIQLPTFPDGVHVLAKFCRELSREAAKLADTIDPPGNNDAATLTTSNDGGPDDSAPEGEPG